ncbi:hypothetical protein [Candidatus Palauibacter sp.]|uniref:hypothetical protein n=1 Tax=Candidatus Palauibacter sp. TaxID=3101350 RepID=UPI003B0178FB
MTVRRTVKCLLLCLLPGLLLACGGSGALDHVPGSTPEWTLRRAVTIGSVDHPTHALSTVGGVLADANHVYVLQPQEGRVRIFTRDGEFVRYLGGEGEGPGEILTPTGQREYFPPVTNLTMGSDDATWLAGPDEDGERTWLVLDDSGASIGRFRLPASSRVAAAKRAEAWVIERDALDIPYVVRYDIVR